MPDLNDLRALIKDHEEKDAGLTIDVAMCMKTWLVEELDDLKREKAEVEEQSTGSMAGADTAELDTLITTKQAEVDAATITIHFKALTEPKYRALLREFPFNDGTTDDQDAEFLGALSEQCYRGVNYGGTEFNAADLSWADVRAGWSTGELAPIHGEVLALNITNKSRRPLSQTRSGKNRRT